MAAISPYIKSESYTDAKESLPDDKSKQPTTSFFTSRPVNSDFLLNRGLFNSCSSIGWSVKI